MANLVKSTIQRNLVGGEPQVKSATTISQLIRLLSWYNSEKESTDAHKWLVEYCKINNPSKANAIGSIDPSKINNTMGWVARLLNRGVQLVEGTHDKLTGYINNFVVVDEIKSRNNSAKNYIDRYLPDFEQAFDQLEKFSAYEYLTTNKVPQIYVQRISEYYSKVLVDYAELPNTDDPQLKEGYRHLSKTDIRQHQEWLTSVISDCSRFLNNTKKERVVRKPKPKSVQTLLKHFKPMKEYIPLKITSVDPSSIIGASVVFTFNTTNNVATIFVAADGGLNISRSSITNYDESKTVSKRIGRTAEKTIGYILKTNKKQSASILSSLDTSAVSVVDRVNDKVIILRVLK